MAAAFLPDLLKENVDGEALLWAAERAGTRPTVLIVISDGAPVDDATLSANPPDILHSHVMAVIDALDARPNWAVTGLGLGYRVDRYYPCSEIIAQRPDIGPMVSRLLTRAVARI